MSGDGDGDRQTTRGTAARHFCGGERDPQREAARSTGAWTDCCAENGFDGFAEEACREFYAGNRGRPGVPPGVYFRMLMVGYLEGIGSERGIAWRCADSFSLREFLGYGLAENPPEHSTLSKTRKRLSVEAHAAVFGFVLERLQVSGLLRGKTLGVDATTLEANAALRTIVRRADGGREYEEWLAQLARASGIETPTREDLAKLDRKRPNKGSNKDWVHPHDPEARITKMKDGRTHLAHKLEHAVDMETGAIVGLTVQTMDGGDTASLPVTLDEAERQLAEAGVEAQGGGGGQGLPLERDHDGREGAEAAGVRERAQPGAPEVEGQAGRAEGDLCQPPADPGQPGQAAAARARGEPVSSGRSRTCLRPAACAASTFGARRIFENEMLVHAAAFNLGLLMRKRFGVGTPRALQGLAAIQAALSTQVRQPASCAFSPVSGAFPPFPVSRISPPHEPVRPASCTTTPRPRVRFLSQPSSAGHPLLPRAASSPWIKSVSASFV